MDDTISRRETVKAIRDAMLAWSYMAQWREDKIVDAVKALPSAQPQDIARDIANIIENEKDMRVIAKNAQTDIILCKDCKHRDPEDKKCDSGHFIRWQLPRDDDWFCADAERRKG